MGSFRRWGLIRDLFLPVGMSCIERIRNGVHFVELDQGLLAMQVTSPPVSPGPFAAFAFIGFDKAVDVQATILELRGVKATTVNRVGTPQSNVTGVEHHVLDPVVLLILRHVVQRSVVRIMLIVLM